MRHQTKLLEMHSMGLLGLIKGVKKTVEGLVDGDLQKVGTGIADTAIGVITSLDGDSDDASSREE